MPTPNTNVKLGVGNVDIIYAIQNLKTEATASVTVANGATTSGEYYLNGNMLVGLLIPSTWDGGNITVQGSDVSGGTYVDIYDSVGSIVTVTVGGASRIVSLTGNPLQAVANVPYIKLKTASAVGADRTIKILAKG